MIRTIGETVVAFDCEWIPDIPAARFIERDAPPASDEQCLDILWCKNGATDDNPHPFLKFAHSRLVSIAMMVRKAPLTQGAPAELSLRWFPTSFTDQKKMSEKYILTQFLHAVEQKKPQLVGFNSKHSDLRILMQRALILGVPAKGFLERPAKPWEGIDYFARDNEGSIDLMELIVGNYNRSATLNLNDACTLCGIPGKFDSHGDEVFELWKANKISEIVQYNCYDAISTYLLWLRLTWISGAFTTDAYQAEVELTRDFLMGLAEMPQTAFIGAYLNELDRLETLYQTWRE